MKRAGSVLAMAGFAVLTGCATPPPSPYVPETERGVTTAGFDAYDYQQVAKDLSQEMMRRGLPPGYVVALGPVDTRGTPYALDIRLLQDKMEVALSQNGTLKFTSAIDALRTVGGAERTYDSSARRTVDARGTVDETRALPREGGGGATEEIYKIIEYNWWQKNPMDAEDLQKFGRIANVGALLFGRVSSIERRLPGRGREVTYTFIWRLTDTATGVNQFTLEKEYRKNLR